APGAAKKTASAAKNSFIPLGDPAASVAEVPVSGKENPWLLIVSLRREMAPCAPRFAAPRARARRFRSFSDNPACPRDQVRHGDQPRDAGLREPPARPCAEGRLRRRRDHARHTGRSLELDGGDLQERALDEDPRDRLYRTEGRRGCV